jgi:hypothetical protein
MKNREIPVSNAENALYFRNAGTESTDEPRNLQQMLSTEGMIASFFIKMMHSTLPTIKPDSSFYSLFASVPEQTGILLRETIQPLENQYLKIFYVLNRHVDQTRTVKSQMLDFIDGYCFEFPEERSVVAALFKDWSGFDYPADPGKPIWILNKNHAHGILVMDQFGGITLPFYTFNLNAAGMDDLMTFDEMDRQSAGKIIEYIKSSGPLENLSDLEKIPEISSGAVSILVNSPFDPQFFARLDEYKLSLTVRSLLSSGIFHLLKYLGAWYVILLVTGFMLYRLYFRVKFTWKHAVFTLLRILSFFLLAAVPLLLVNKTAAWFLGISLFLLLIFTLILNKRKTVRQMVFGNLLVIAAMLYSLI